MTAEDMARRKEMEAEMAARAAWPGLARMAGLLEARQVLHVLRTRTLRGETRVLLRVEGPGHGGLILKHVPDEASQWFDKQIEAHRRAMVAFDGVEDLGVPSLLAWDRDQRAMLMERVAGLTAQAEMEQSDGAGRLRVLRACGRWLGHLHRAGEMQFGRLRPGPVLNRLHAWTGAVEAGQMTVPDLSGFRALAAFARAAAEAARGVKCTRGVVHGDMNLRNLILDGERVWGLDFGHTGLNPPALDLARVLVRHETFFGPVDGDPVDTPQAARAALLEGHAGRRRDRTALDHLMAADLVRLWMTIPAARLERSILEQRRWRGVQRMAARLLG